MKGRRAFPSQSGFRPDYYLQNRVSECIFVRIPLSPRGTLEINARKSPMMQLFKTAGNAAWGILFSLFLFGSLLAQQAPDPDIQRYRQQIEECNQVIQSWQFQANLQIIFVVAVLTFGALITIFQGRTKGWTKPATLVLGACTTILTGVNAKVFSADYRVLQQSAIDGSQLVDQLNETLDGLGRPGANEDSLKKQWLATKTQFAGLRRAVLQGTNKTADFQVFPRPVYAQSRVPTWVIQPPSDKYNVYFTGVGEGHSLDVARQRSMEAAVATGADKLSAASGRDNESLRQILSSSATTDKSYFGFDNANGVYRYYTLLRVSSDINPPKAAAVTIDNPWFDMSYTKLSSLLLVSLFGLVPAFGAELIRRAAQRKSKNSQDARSVR